MGQFDTHGGYFAPQGYFKVEAGGSHDENPNGGVQIGVDPQGVPNMLEEGEPVYNDYVYSDNIEADEEMLRKHNLPTKLAGKCYSEIADSFIDAYRPNDAISNNGTRAMLLRLADAQEEQKQRQQQKELEDELASLSPEEQEQLLAMLAEQEAGQEAVPVDETMVSPDAVPVEEAVAPEQMMANGGTLLRTFQTGTPGELTILSPFRKRQKLDEVAQAILDNEAAKNVGVNPETGMRYEAPLEDKHPGLDLALMYAQPGTLLAKFMAPSIVRGAVNGIMNGEGAMALMGGPAAAPKGFNFAKQMNNAEKARDAAKASSQLAGKAQKSISAYNSAHAETEALRTRMAKRKAELDVIKSDFNAASEAYARGDVPKVQLELLGKKAEAKAARIDKLQEKFSAASKTESGARLKAGKDSKAAGIEFKPSESRAAAASNNQSASNSLAPWQKVALGIGASILGGYGIYGFSGTRPGDDEDVHYVEKEWTGWDDYERNNGAVDTTLTAPVPAVAPVAAPEIESEQKSFLDSLINAKIKLAHGGPMNRCDFGNKIEHINNPYGLINTDSPVFKPLPYTVKFDPLTGHMQKKFSGISYTPTYPVGQSTSTKTNTTLPVNNSYSIGPLSTNGQYAKAITAGIVGLYDTFQDQDRYRALPYNAVTPSARMHLVDPRYVSIDQNKTINDILADSAKITDAIAASVHGPSRAGALIAHDYVTGRNLGLASATDAMANNEARNAVINARSQNASTLGTFDYSQSRDRANILNNKALHDIEMDLKLQGANYTEEGQKYAAIQNQIDTVADALAKIGRQNVILNQLRSNTALDWKPSNSGWSAYYGYAPYDVSRMTPEQLAYYRSLLGIKDAEV